MGGQGVRAGWQTKRAIGRSRRKQRGRCRRSSICRCGVRNRIMRASASWSPTCNKASVGEPPGSACEQFLAMPDFAWSGPTVTVGYGTEVGGLIKMKDVETARRGECGSSDLVFSESVKTRVDCNCCGHMRHVAQEGEVEDATGRRSSVITDFPGDFLNR